MLKKTALFSRDGFPKFSKLLHRSHPCHWLGSQLVFSCMQQETLGGISKDRQEEVPYYFAFLLWGILTFVFITWTQFKLLWVCHYLLVWKKSALLVFLFYFTPVLCERETLRTMSLLSLHWIWFLSMYRYHWEGGGACRLSFVFFGFKGDHYLVSRECRQ